MKRPVVLVVVGLGLGAAWLYFGAPLPHVTSAPSTEPTRAESMSGDKDDGNDNENEGDDVSPTHAPLPPQPADHDGTDVDGDLDIGPEGHLLITPAVRRVFDYFLMDVGAESPEIIEARLFETAGRDLPPPALKDLRRLWHKYRAMRAEFASLRPDSEHANASGAVQALDALTAKYFSPAEREALFGEELREAHAVLGPLQDLQATPDMPQAQRELEWQRVQEHQSPVTRAAEARAMRAADYLKQEQALGGDRQAVRRLRQDALGPEAAARLDALDAQRAAWQARLAALRAERDRLRADDSLSDEDRDAQVQRLIEQRFDEHERVRVHALVDRE